MTIRIVLVDDQEIVRAGLRLLLQSQTDMGIVGEALTLHEDAQHFFEMASAGASGYIPKRAATTDLVTAVRTVHAGQMYVHPSIAQTLVEGYRQRTHGHPEPSHPGDLEPHEQQVLEMIVQGAQNKKIALRLGVNVRTVARYRVNIQNKLNLHSRAELVRYAVDKGLVNTEGQGAVG